MKQKKTLIILGGALVVLALLTIGLRACNAREEQRQEEEEQSIADTRVLETAEDQTYTEIFYDNGETTLSFARDEEGNWYWVDDPEFPLNGYYLDSISTQIIELHPMQTITDGDTLEAYGLEDPSATLTAVDEEGAETVLLYGNTTSDGSYYMKTGDSDTVYVVSSTLRDSMNKGIYDMAKLPDIPTFTDSNLISVAIQSPTQDFVITIEPAADSEDSDSADSSSSSSADSSSSSADSSEESTSRAAWIVNGTDVTDSETVSDLANELAALHFDSCEDYKPTDEAVSICGLNSPQLTITVTYTTDGGSESTFKMSVGSETADGMGYYARMEGDTTIYSVTESTVETLLTLAADGWSA